MRLKARPPPSENRLIWSRRPELDTRTCQFWSVGPEKLVRIDQDTGEVVIMPLMDPEFH